MPRRPAAEPLNVRVAPLRVSEQEATDRMTRLLRLLGRIEARLDERKAAEVPDTEKSKAAFVPGKG